MAGREVYPEDDDTVYQDFSVEEFVERRPDFRRTACETESALMPTQDD